MENDVAAQASPRPAPLANPKHEAFAKAIARGQNQSRAYVDAGFSYDSGRASTLAKNDDVITRVAILTLEFAELREAGLEETIRALLTMAGATSLQTSAAGMKEARTMRMEAWRLSELLVARGSAIGVEIAPRALTEAEWEAKYGADAPVAS